MVCFDEFEAEDDVRAVRQAERQVQDGMAAELWCGDRRVAASVRAVESDSPE